MSRSPSFAPWINPGLFLSFILTSLVAFVDITLGIITLFLCYYPISEFDMILEMFDELNYKNDVAWWGVTSIPLFAALGLISGYNQLMGICHKKKDSSSFSWKITVFLLFFVSEVFGFILPFKLVEDYEKKVTLILGLPKEGNGKYIVFNLLLVNTVTIGLFVYQVVSFAVVFNHSRLMAKKLLEELRKEGLHKNVNKDVEMGTLDSKATLGQSPVVESTYPQLDQLMEDLPPRYLYPLVPEDLENSSVIPTPSMALFLSKQGHVGIQKIGKAEAEISKFVQMKGAQLAKGKLFEDPDFPANKVSLGRWEDQVEWKRPHEINSQAKFFSDGVTRFDVKQGKLGDCWFLAALANLTLNDTLFAKVVPFDNEWFGGNAYAGVCYFNLFKDGKWRQVIIDDRLPTRNGKLIYMSSSDPTEFWSALIEKGMAKLYGSYGKLDGNDGIGPAMVNLTGGTVERHHEKWLAAVAPYREGHVGLSGDMLIPLQKFRKSNLETGRKLRAFGFGIRGEVRLNGKENFLTNTQFGILWTKRWRRNSNCDLRMMENFGSR
ncbi:calpain-2 catalytic subunit isoform X2 [Folsomia candida]|uniref:calpain-2 catalytic subunit isoform X2 n=1 Tax=Folsomia candida TaxID=158441 RepID=UPI0016051BEC|nr:calpain-2 catalytic subunit isoform X2 [Folsomia candida]